MIQPILKVDLSTKDIGHLKVPSTWQSEYLGGASLAARLLYDELQPGLDPLSPSSPLLFMTGPLTGTSGPAVGRFVVCGKSPATNLWAESNCGGFWGPELRKAGYAGLWITGWSEEPVYIWINDDSVEICSAKYIWGLETYQTQAAVREDIGENRARIAVIGPAGENLLPFALILTDHGRVAGRTGMGAVMGSKNLKAIAVKGSGSVPLALQEEYAHQRSIVNREIREDPVSAVLRELGTAGSADYFDYLGEMPKRYFQRCVFPDADKVTGATLTDKYLTRISTCHACVIACGRVVNLGDAVGSQPLPDQKGPEYETMVGFGPNLWLDDLEFVTRMGDLCDRYGMDTISLSNTIGLAYTLFEQGVIDARDTSGLVLDWGHKDNVENLVHKTVRLEGFGKFISEGARSLGRRFAAEQEAVQVNGLEVAYHDPRGSSGMALVYATSPRGACHNQSDYFLVDIGQVEESLDLELYNRLDGAEKARNVAVHQNWRTVFNSLVMCIFANVPPDDLLRLINTSTGNQLELPELLLAGERAWNLKRMINIKLGLKPEDDRIPAKLLRPLEDAHGEMAGFAPDIASMISAYYLTRGWDPVTGLPSAETRQQLGLAWAD